MMSLFISGSWNHRKTVYIACAISRNVKIYILLGRMLELFRFNNITNYFQLGFKEQKITIKIYIYIYCTLLLFRLNPSFTKIKARMTYNMMY